MCAVLWQSQIPVEEKPPQHLGGGLVSLPSLQSRFSKCAADGACSRSPEESMTSCWEIDVRLCLLLQLAPHQPHIPTCFLSCQRKRLLGPLWKVSLTPVCSALVQRGLAGACNSFTGNAWVDVCLLSESLWFSKPGPTPAWGSAGTGRAEGWDLSCYKSYMLDKNESCLTPGLRMSLKLTALEKSQKTRRQLKRQVVASAGENNPFWFLQVTVSPNAWD